MRDGARKLIGCEKMDGNGSRKRLPLEWTVFEKQYEGSRASSLAKVCDLGHPGLFFYGHGALMACAPLDGLTHIFSTIKETTDVRSLPPSYQAVTQWARISLVSPSARHPYLH